jgi:hypothetical protein
MIYGIRHINIQTAKALAAATEPAEFIRDCDYVIDIEKELEKQVPGLKQTGDSVREMIIGIKTKIDDLFK